MSEATMEVTSEAIGFSVYDRYGTAGPPAWIRGCHGPCEATGFYPVKAHSSDLSSARAMLRFDESLTLAEREAVTARIAAGDFQSDGWYFIRCPECDGAGRVSWARALARVPRWIGRGVVRLWRSRPSVSRAMWPEGTSWAQIVRVNLWAAFGADCTRLLADVRAGARRG